jgi:fumarate hydratase subunit alpha
MERGADFMRSLDVEVITDAVDRLCRQACCQLPEDVVRALESAEERELPGSAAQSVLLQILENARLALDARRPCCQDTGMAVVFLDIGTEVHLLGDVYKAVDAGVERAYREGHMRASVLHPLTRRNTGNNTPAAVHVRLVPGGSTVLVQVAPKGFGSENKSRLIMLTPADGRRGVVEAIVETVVQADACACPPLVVGVGIGGTMEQAALLAKRQLLRPLGQPALDEEVRAVEEEALARINGLGIGPMGLGGKTTALSVQAAALPTHIAGLPLAVNLCCHACRHAAEVL